MAAPIGSPGDGAAIPAARSAFRCASSRLFATAHAFLASLVLAYFLAHVVEFMGASTLLDGAHVGFWVWLGFVATTSVGAYLFEGRPLALYLINAGGYLAGLAVMGALLAVM